MVIMALIALPLVLQGCAVFTVGEKEISPDYQRLMVWNYSPYIIELHGPFVAHLEPGQSAAANIMCKGRFAGTANAYKKRAIDKKTGKVDYELFGQARYSFKIDGRNTVKNDYVVDDWMIFTEYSFRSLMNGRQIIEQDYPGNPCTLGPTYEWSVPRLKR